MNSKLISNSKSASVSTLFLLLGLNLAITNKAQALELVFSPANSGWVGENGLRFQDNTNYFVGDCRGAIGQCGVQGGINPGSEVRNFFSFDTSGYSFTNITSAKLRLQLPKFTVTENVDPNYPVGTELSGFVSVDGTENFQLFDIANNNISLLNSGYAEGDLTGQSLFDDLGTGSSLSSAVTINDTTAPDFVDITLNQAGISQILSNGQFAFGGAITTLDGNANDEFAFGYTNPAFNSLNPNALDVLNRIQLIIDADEVEITAEKRGFVSETGLNFNNNNYAVGDCRGDFGQCHTTGIGNVRNFFVFNLENVLALQNTGISSSLSLGIPDQFNYTVGGQPKTGVGFFTDDPNGTESYRLFDVGTSINDLTAFRSQPNSTGQNIYFDLGTGDSYSSAQPISLSDIGKFKEISLNAGLGQPFNNDLMDALGDKLAIGGAITTLTPGADDELIFGFTNNSFQQVGADPVGASLILRNAPGGGFSSSSLALQANNLRTSNPWTPRMSLLGLPDESFPVVAARALSLVDDSEESSFLGGIDTLSSAIGVNNTQSTPEPSALLALIGLGGLGLFGRKKGKKSVN